MVGDIEKKDQLVAEDKEQVKELGTVESPYADDKVKIEIQPKTSSQKENPLKNVAVSVGHFFGSIGKSISGFFSNVGKNISSTVKAVGNNISKIKIKKPTINKNVAVKSETSSNKVEKPLDPKEAKKLKEKAKRQKRRKRKSKKRK